MCIIFFLLPDIAPGEKHPPLPSVFNWNHLEVFGLIPTYPRFQWSNTGLMWRKQISPFVLTFFHIFQAFLSPEFTGCARFPLWTTTSTLPCLLPSCLSPPLAETILCSPISTFWLCEPLSLSPSRIMSNYRSRRVSMGSSSIPSHQSLCLCLLVYLLLLFSALSWRPDGTQVSAPHGDSYCKLSLHLQSFKTLPKWDFIYSLYI